MFFFSGFQDELEKIAGSLSEAGKVSGEATEYIGQLASTAGGRAIGSTGSGVAGAGAGSLIGTLMAGKGRRGKGAALGAILGALVGSGKGVAAGKQILRAGKDLREAGEKSASDRAVQNVLDRRLKRHTAEGAATWGGMAALLAALASKKGTKLKRALAGGAAGGAAGGLVGLKSGSDGGNQVHALAKSLREST